MLLFMTAVKHMDYVTDVQLQQNDLAVSAAAAWLTTPPKRKLISFIHFANTVTATSLSQEAAASSTKYRTCYSLPLLGSIIRKILHDVSLDMSRQTP